jgi:WS/DGAT/MGAT family acyltransferase
MLVPVRLSLDAVKAEGRSHDATVNDILLARVTTGLRALLLSRGEHPDHALNALVPISRRRSEQRGAAGNQVTAMIVRLPVDEPDPAGRLAAIRSQTRELKQSPEGPAFATLLGWADAWPPALVALTSKLVHHQPFVNIVVTNVPGPTATLTFLGAAITDLVPVVPLARNLGIGVAIVSYRGELIIGLHADAATCPDVDVMAAAMQG